MSARFRGGLWRTGGYHDTKDHVKQCVDLIESRTVTRHIDMGQWTESVRDTYLADVKHALGQWRAKHAVSWGEEHRFLMQWIRKDFIKEEWNPTGIRPRVPNKWMLDLLGRGPEDKDRITKCVQSLNPANMKYMTECSHANVRSLNWRALKTLVGKVVCGASEGYWKTLRKEIDKGAPPLPIT